MDTDEEKSPSDEPVSSLNPENVRQEAIRLAKLEEDLTRLLERYFETIPSREGTIHIDEHTDIYKSDEFFYVASLLREISGIGPCYVGFYHFFQYPQEAPMIPNIDTTNRLDINIHTDEQTLEEVTRLLESDPLAKNYLGTSYFVDQEGNNGKMIYLPGQVKDHRKNIGPIHGKRAVIGQMGSWDFEVAGAILNMLKQKIQPLFPASEHN
ncbi:MAG: hypothetical protein AAB414_04880 [Patescibacteria group bacterium]